MMDPPVSRTPAFLQALKFLFRKEYAEAIDRLNLLRNQYANDQYSRLEIDRYMVQALEGIGRKEESLLLLFALEPQLVDFQYEMSLHYLSVVSLLQTLQRLEQLHTYCKAIGGACRAEDALGHLDWIVIYAESSNDSEPTEFMRAILALCASRLGLHLPSSGLIGDVFHSTARRYCVARDAANDRYGSFWHEHQRLAASNVSQSTLHDHVKRYIQSEPTPVFQDIARALLTESNVCCPKKQPDDCQ